MRLTFLVFCILIFGNLFSQDPYALKLNKKVGLPSQSVYHLHQDKTGFIWFASDVGLTRFDGFRFVNYYSDNQTSFAGSCIQEDKYGRVWYENFDGFLYYVDPIDKKLKGIEDKNSLGYLPYGITDKYLFHTDENEINAYDLKTLKKVKSFPLKVIEPQHSGSSRKYFFLIEGEQLYRVNNKLELKVESISFLDGSHKQVYPISDSLIVLLNKFNESGEFYLVNTETFASKTIKLPELKIIHLVNYIDNHIWISSPLGTHVFDLEGNILNHFFPGISISGVIKDKQKNYWFSSTNQGVFIVPKLGNKFLFDSNYLPCKIVPYKENSYLISTKKGQIFQVDSSFKILKTIIDEPEQGEIFYLHYDNNKDIISYTGNRFYRLDAKSLNRIKAPEFSVKEIVSIDDKFMAFAASNVSGLFWGDQKLHSEWDLLNFPVEDLYQKIITNQRTRSVTYNSEKKIIYYATNNGLFKLTKKGLEEIKLDGNSFYSSRLSFFKNELYALSTKGNLYKIHDNQNFELLNSFYDVNEYDIRFLRNFGDKLVFASSSYIYQIKSEKGEFEIYNLNISEYDINDILVLEHDLYLVINEGIIKSSISKNDKQISKPVLVFNSLVSKDLEFNTNDFIELNYNYNEVRIDYSILDFGKSIPTVLYYRINNSEWRKTSALSRELNFPSLESGSYTVDFKFKDSDDIQSVRFQILKPWWREWWFYLIIVFSSILTGYLYYRSRVKFLSDKNLLLQENIQLEKNLRQSVLTTIKSQMNPHFLYNALNTIQAYIYANDKENAGKFLIKFSKLTRKVLEMSEQESVPLDEEIDTITLYLELEKARFDEDFNFTIDASMVIQPEMIKVPPMLIQPYLENAIKHGLLHKSGQKLLTITFVQWDKFLEVTIDDNGIGRKKSIELNHIRAKNHKSFASDANAKRLEVLNYGKTDKLSVEYTDKHDEHNNPIGTRVVLRIPI